MPNLDSQPLIVDCDAQDASCAVGLVGEVVERLLEEPKDMLALLRAELNLLQIGRGDDLTPDAIDLEHVSRKLPDTEQDLLEILGLWVGGLGARLRDIIMPARRIDVLAQSRLHL